MWKISKIPSFEPGQRVRKRLIGQGYIHGTVLEEDPAKDDTRYTVAWDNGPVSKSIENPLRLMKAEDFVFSPTTAAQPVIDDKWHTVPSYDHREKAKYKPGDLVMTSLGPVEIIQPAVTPLGQMYRVTDKFSGSVFDIFERDIQGKPNGTMYYAQQTV